MWQREFHCSHLLWQIQAQKIAFTQCAFFWRLARSNSSIAASRSLITSSSLPFITNSVRCWCLLSSSPALNKDLLQRYAEDNKHQQRTELVTKGSDDDVVNDLEAAIDELLVASRQKNAHWVKAIFLLESVTISEYNEILFVTLL